MKLDLNAVNVEMPDLDSSLLIRWIRKVAENHNYRVGDITYVFVDDEEILKINKEFLQHDYYTDIITFDYSRRGLISGDMYISLDTVATNAEINNASYRNELNRVIIHGILHLCGINDKGPGEREIMEARENEALQLLAEMHDCRDDK